MLLLFARFIAAFSAYGKSIQIGFAMSMGLALALIPGGTLFWFVVFVPMMLIRINQAAMLGTMGVFRLLAPVYDPSTESLGYFLLTRPAVREPLGALLSLPGLSWFRIDDSFVVGGTAAAILVFPISLTVFTLLVLLYRRFIASAVKRLFAGIGSKVPWLKKLGHLVGVARRTGVAW